MTEIAAVIATALVDDFESEKDALSERTRALMERYPLYPAALGRGGLSRLNIWVDMTAPAHVLVLRPIIERLRAQGHAVEVTSRDYAQTQALLDLHGMEHTPIGRHGGASRLRKALPARRAHRGDAPLRPRALLRPRPRPRLQRPGDRRARCSASPRRTCTTTSTRSPSTSIGCRLARRVMFPDSVPAGAAAPLRRRPGEALPVSRARRRSTTSTTSSPTRRRSERLGVDTARVVVIVRPPPDVSLYHRKSNPLFPQGPRPARPATRTSTRSSCRAPRRSASWSRASRCPR